MYKNLVADGLHTDRTHTAWKSAYKECWLVHGKICFVVVFFVRSLSLCPLIPKFFSSAAHGQILFDGPTCVQCAADVFN